MVISQISVFVENKPGTLAELIKVFSDHNIDLKALSLAETPEYGIVRVIVDDTEKTTEMLRSENWTCKKNHVLQVLVPDEPGSLLKIFSILGENQINIAYSYAFYSGEKGSASLIMRLDDNEKAIELLNKAGISC